MASISACANTTKKENVVTILNDSCLLFFHSSYNNKKWSCSGSFVNKDTIITAAHCGEAFNDSGFQIDNKNKVAGFCKIKNQEVELKIKSFLTHPSYSFDDVKTNHYDIAILKLKKEVDIKVTSKLETDQSKIQELVQHNDCFIAGYKDTLSKKEEQSVVKTPPHYIYLNNIYDRGIKFQMDFNGNKAIVHGGAAENKINNSMKESRLLKYPGSGYSGSNLICSDKETQYKVGVYVGGFKKSKTWVSLLFLEDISAWLKENI